MSSTAPTVGEVVAGLPAVRESSSVSSTPALPSLGSGYGRRRAAWPREEPGELTSVSVVRVRMTPRGVVLPGVAREDPGGELGPEVVWNVKKMLKNPDNYFLSHMHCMVAL